MIGLTESIDARLTTRCCRYKDLASNLVGIANQGQNAFIEAYSDMLQIGSKTNGMGRIGGTVSSRHLANSPDIRYR